LIALGIAFVKGIPAILPTEVLPFPRSRLEWCGQPRRHPFRAPINMSPFFRKRSQDRKPKLNRGKRTFSLEQLENRSLLTTFAVLNLDDSGAGSLRQAILDANTTVGQDIINFDVAGVIALKSSLPTVTDRVDIAGTSAPGFDGTPVVEINFNRNPGLKFVAGSQGSSLQSLAFINATTSGVKLDGVGQMLIVGNYFGVTLDGVTAAKNFDHGLELVNSDNNTIGGTIDAARNVLSANKVDGLYLGGSSNNVILGNYIGTDATGASALGNGRSGIVVTGESLGNTIGGAAGNVISANDSHGIHIKDGAGQNTVSGNIIGLNAEGAAAIGNGGSGVRIGNANGNLIGDADPVGGIDYYDADGVEVTVSGWQGIRGGDSDDEVLITGTSNLDGLLYVGSIDGQSGTAYTFQYPNAYNTSAYGPNNLGDGNLQIVGIYKNPDYETAAVGVNGFLYEGTASDLGNAGNYRTIDYPGAKFNYVHSTAGGLAVGNYDSPDEHGSFDLPFGPGNAYIYDIATDSFIADVSYPGAVSNTAYGIWYNGGTSYTIVGGYSLDPVNNFDDPHRPIGQAYMVDYDSESGEFSHWKSFEYPSGTTVVTHFEGISSVEKGVYTLVADTLKIDDEPAQGSVVTVRRNTDGSFGDGDWVDLQYPGTDPSTSIASANSIYGSQVVGIVIDDEPFSFQANINVGFQLSNVISGNKASGIEISGGNENRVSMNYIGTDITGEVDLGNGHQGILVTDKSANNLIGGEATGGNDPTNGVFLQPPLGNVISGNDANGVLINGKATGNQLSGNFIGTDSSGNVALGNSGDGVLIDRADGNSLIGCTFQEDPFVFYNVVSGNGGNGLRVNNSDNTTIQANFFGLGADNDTPLGNALNGVVVEGSSAHTAMGGPIPLGNVTVANGQNGIAVQDKASDFFSYNTFAGVSAFGEQTNLGNWQDGVLITSSGKDILLRTNVISGNSDDGVEISGKARGVQVSENIIGMNWDGSSAMANRGNGIEISGKARDILIGGALETPSVIRRNTISANGEFGVAVLGKAKNTLINHSYIGTDIAGEFDFGNVESGIYLGPGTSGATIGSTDAALLTVISGNGDSGIAMIGTSGNTVIGSYIGTDVTGLLDIGNDENGVDLINSSKNTIGGTGTGQANRIAFNDNDGVFVQSGERNAIVQNAIFGNDNLGIELGAGANNDQPAPVLTTATADLSGIQVTGTLTAKKKTSYTLEFFASDADGSSGRHYLGSLVVKTNKSGVAEFTYTGSAPPIGADFITATATDPKNNTSQFSLAIST